MEYIKMKISICCIGIHSYEKWKILRPPPAKEGAKKVCGEMVLIQTRICKHCGKKQVHTTEVGTTPHEFTIWKMKSQGNLLDGKRVVGTFIEQYHDCTICGKVETRTERTHIR